MADFHVDVKSSKSDLWHAYTNIPGGVGRAVIGSGRSEFQAQSEAAKFLDTNYPGKTVSWEGGYHGGEGAKPQETYYRKHRW